MDLVAAVDLGSNSFHLIVVRVLPDGEFQVVDRLKEEVRLAAGLQPDGTLSPQAQERALATLARMGQRLAELPTERVRVVGTNTLRKARNQRDFLVRGAIALGHPIEIVSGREEARLIYQGVSRELEGPQRRLVIDIGGGSTELILGEGPTPNVLDSLYMGCVSWSRAFFPDGTITAEAFSDAVTAARIEIEGAAPLYRSRGWEQAVGSSGTINAVEQILLASGWCERGVTRRGVEKLGRALVKARHIDHIDLPGLGEGRRPVLVGGVAILQAVMAELRLDHLTASQSALREGLIVEQIGRIQRHDLRAATVERLAQRYHLDHSQAARIEATALSLFDQAAEPWGLLPAHRDLLAWAARLHEIGVSVSYSGHHKHGAYLLAHADMPGFSRQEQGALATLVLTHRGALGEARLLRYPHGPQLPVRRLVALLRLAHRLHRGRTDQPLPHLGIEVDQDSLLLWLPEPWLQQHPLSRDDLAAETRALRNIGLRLSVAAIEP